MDRKKEEQEYLGDILLNILLISALYLPSITHWRLLDTAKNIDEETVQKLSNPQI
jgi:hypothetical protein